MYLTEKDDWRSAVSGVAMSAGITLGLLAVWFSGFMLISAIGVSEPVKEPVSEPEPPVIVETKPAPDPVLTTPPVSDTTVFEEPEADLVVQEQLAIGIYREGGGDAICDDCRLRIGDVMLNRVMDDRYPDTLAEVLTQKGQYNTMYWDGITWPERADNPGEAHAVERACDTAANLMSGTHSELYGAGYIFQSEFPNLGHDVFQHCGIYFAKG